MIDLISSPWHWSVSGFFIALVMFALLYAGKEFGVSSNLRTMCTIAGAGKRSEFFRIDWKAQRWNLLFVAGAVIGGFLATQVFPSAEPLAVSEATEQWLLSEGIQPPSSGAQGAGYVPRELFGVEGLGGVHLLFLVVGGFLVGFGTRWAGGCTSGHAISGLSNLQVPSLIAVIGFFIGGLIMTWLVLPSLLSLYA